MEAVRDSETFHRGISRPIATAAGTTTILSASVYCTQALLTVLHVSTQLGHHQEMDPNERFSKNLFVLFALCFQTLNLNCKMYYEITIETRRKKIIIYKTHQKTMQ
jgi:hypothetical protein